MLFPGSTSFLESIQPSSVNLPPNTFKTFSVTVRNYTFTFTKNFLNISYIFFKAELNINYSLPLKVSIPANAESGHRHLLVVTAVPSQPPQDRPPFTPVQDFQINPIAQNLPTLTLEVSNQ